MIRNFLQGIEFNLGSSFALEDKRLFRELAPKWCAKKNMAGRQLHWGKPVFGPCHTPPLRPGNTQATSGGLRWRGGSKWGAGGGAKAPGNRLCPLAFGLAFRLLTRCRYPDTPPQCPASPPRPINYRPSGRFAASPYVLIPPRLVIAIMSL
jgi:hypothetical protein